MFDKLRFLLLQVRNQDDPMRDAEVACFARALACRQEQIERLDLLQTAPTFARLQRFDMILLGGSGHYSVTTAQPWLARADDGMRLLHDTGKPTFASCFGFQAMARALGGAVVQDRERAELGTHHLRLTPAGRQDPVFGALGDKFYGQMGHEDIVTRLPPDAILLASTPLVENQAFTFADKPIWCTQFHPELNRSDLLQRVAAYPEYVEKVSGMTLDRFIASCYDTPETEALLPRMVRHVFGD